MLSISLFVIRFIGFHFLMWLMLRMFWVGSCLIYSFFLSSTPRWRFGRERVSSTYREHGKRRYGWYPVYTYNRDPPLFLPPGSMTCYICRFYSIGHFLRRPGISFIRISLSFSFSFLSLSLSFLNLALVHMYSRLRNWIACTTDNQYTYSGGYFVIFMGVS